MINVFKYVTEAESLRLVNKLNFTWGGDLQSPSDAVSDSMREKPGGILQTVAGCHP